MNAITFATLGILISMFTLLFVISLYQKDDKPVPKVYVYTLDILVTLLIINLFIVVLMIIPAQI